MKLYKICNKISLLLHVLASAAGYFVMEAICRHSFIEAWNYMTQRPLVFAYNAAFIFTSSLIVYLFHRRVFWRVLVTLFWLILAIINGVLLLNRVTPFTGPDLHLITDAMKIANKYLPVAGVVAVCILFGILVILLLMLLIKGPKYQKKIKYRYNIPLILLAVALFAGRTQLALEKRGLSNYFGNIAFAYEDYGYPYCLATTIFTPAERNKLNTPSSKFSETLEDAARSCESEVDIVEASIPARITPAIMAKIMPCVLNTWAI